MKSSRVWIKPPVCDNSDSDSDNDNNSSVSSDKDIEIKLESTCNSDGSYQDSLPSESVRFPVGLENDALNFNKTVQVPDNIATPTSVMKKISQKFVSRSVDLQSLQLKSEVKTGSCSGVGVPVEEQGRDERCYMYNQLPAEAVEASEDVDGSSHSVSDSATQSEEPVDSDGEADVKSVSDSFSEYESLDDSFVKFKDDSGEDEEDGRKSRKHDDEEYFPPDYRRRKKCRRGSSNKNKCAGASQVKDECLDPVMSDSWKIPDVMRLSDKTYACTFCIQICAKLKDAREHVLTHYEFSCNHCDKKFLTAEHVELHIRNEHDGNAVKCLFSSCDFIAESKDVLSKHISQNHANEDMLNCSTSFDDSGNREHTNTNRNVSRHRKRTTTNRCTPGNGSNSGLCYICGVQKKCLREHLYNVHGTYGSRYGPGQRDLICEMCGSEFPNRLLLQSHRLAWHTEKTLPCRFSGCPALFKTKGLMQTHYKSVHLGIKRYICTYEGCSFRSGNKSTFANHTKAMHLKIRSHPCTWPDCSKSFYDKKHLVIHERIHSDVKPLCCEFCDYRCRQRAALNWHLTKKHKEETAKTWEVSSTISNDWRHADVPVGIPAATHALKPGRKKKILS